MADSLCRRSFFVISRFKGCRDVNLQYSTESCMEIGSWKYSGEIILLLVQTILKLFLGVVAFVGVMVE